MFEPASESIDSESVLNFESRRTGMTERASSVRRLWDVRLGPDVIYSRVGRNFETVESRRVGGVYWASLLTTSSKVLKYLNVYS